MLLRIVPHVFTDKVEISRILGSPDDEKEEKRLRSPPSRTSSTTIPPEISRASNIHFNPPVAGMGIPNSELENWGRFPPKYTLTQSAPPQPPPEQISPQQPASSLVPMKRPRTSPPPGKERIKKQSKWSPEEDMMITHLRGRGMKWEDISKKLPNRSPISCRLHYQNYLERRSDWDEDKKNKLARLYERFKADMWSKIAEEMAIPWRAAEAMHWQIGERNMASRAGVTPFTLSNTSSSGPHKGRKTSQPSPRLPRHDYPPITQLPSVAELTAGIPAYAAQLPPPMGHYEIQGSPPASHSPEAVEQNQELMRRSSRSRARRL
ncbi:hypothetical protein FQN57_005583 [Myotisia sp. PD_48]|nr:hypothetical protein FQN57_005583 [Myotisia sp. PD_48]